MAGSTVAALFPVPWTESFLVDSLRHGNPKQPRNVVLASRPADGNPCPVLQSRAATFRLSRARHLSPALYVEVSNEDDHPEH